MLKLDQLLIDDAEGMRRRKKEQEAADGEFARRVQEEEKRKSQTPAAASAHSLPEVDRQMDRLKKDATNLKQANAAQQQLLQQNQFDLQAAKAQIAELQKHQYIRQDFDAPRNHQHQQQQHQQQQQRQDSKPQQQQQQQQQHDRQHSTATA